MIQEIAPAVDEAAGPSSPRRGWPDLRGLIRSVPGRLSSSSSMVSVFAATSLVVFVLPLLLPGRPVQGISASYLAGFNNSIAILGASGLSVAVLLLTLRFSHSRIADRTLTEGRLAWSFVASVLAVSSVLLGLAGALVTAAHERYLGDAGYIIEQAATWSETGRHLYSGIEFAYGPLLLLPEVWLSRLGHLDMTPAYYAVLVFESVLGLLMLVFVLNELPIRPRLRQAALVLLALGAITPHLGLNYTYFRFCSPLALFLFGAKYGKSPLRTAVLLSVGVLLECAISPELAFALAIGILAYAGLRTWQSGPAWLLTGAVPLAVLAALLLTVGHDYLRMVATFSQGVYNLPIGPYPHILILLFALVWFVPVYLGRFVLFTAPGGAAMAGLYAVALATVPAALRRCDPLHVLFDGVGLFVLAFAAASHTAYRARVAWIVCFALFVVWEHRVNERLFSWRTAYTVQRIVLPHTPAPLRPAVIALTAIQNRSVVSVLRQPPEPDQIVDYPTLYRLVGNAPVAIPFEVPPVMEAELKATHHYQPLFQAFAVDMMDNTAERNTVEELAKFRWLLLPTERRLRDSQQTPANIGPIQGVRMYFRQRNAPVFVPGAIFEAGIDRDWTPIATLGRYTLYSHTATR